MRTVYISGLASVALALLVPVQASRAAAPAPDPALSAPTYSDLVETILDAASLKLKEMSNPRESRLACDLLSTSLSEPLVQLLSGESEDPPCGAAHQQT